SGGGGGLFNKSTTSNAATLTNTIVAGNRDASDSPSDISSGVNVLGKYNLIGTGGSGGLVNGSNGNIILTSLANLGLAALGYYGGPTQTTALLPGSAAIGSGFAASGTKDQRGFPLDKPKPDIGAFQFQSTPLVVNTSFDASVGGKLDLRGAIDLANVLPGAQT